MIKFSLGMAAMYGLVYYNVGVNPLVGLVAKVKALFKRAK